MIVVRLLPDPHDRNAPSYLSVMNAGFHEKVLQLVASVAETDEVLANLELPVYECQLLNSIKTAELMIRIEEEFGLKISAAEFERENWGTPRRIIADLEKRTRLKASVGAGPIRRFG